MQDQSNFWLMKTEPEVFSFDDLVKAPKKSTFWDGVRNYQARNFMVKDFKVGDQVFVYHSGTDEPAIVGIAKVSKLATADPTQWDPQSDYFDKSSKRDEPRWFGVEIQAVSVFESPITLAELKGMPQLKDMALLQRGQRLSVQPVTSDEWHVVRSLKKTRLV